MERTCARAVELGLPAVAFTEHADPPGGWAVLASDLEDFPHLRAFVSDARSPEDPVGGTLRPPPLEVGGYLLSVERCREQFPELRIISGVELGEPHRDPEGAARLLKAGRFESVLGSLHSLLDGAEFSEMPNLFRQRQPGDVVRAYLEEVVVLIEGCDAFSVLGHIDYVLRYWPESAAPFDVHAFEDEFRHALAALARSDRTLEVNTRGKLPPEIVRWWREEGGQSVAFGSDAHAATGLARGFIEAQAMVEAVGFRPGETHHDFWRC
jgi:histidinol-phosphatase (PHP family)